MNLWRRIPQRFLRVFSRSKRNKTKDPDTALLRDLATSGMPIPLASVKAAVDAAAADREAKALGPVVDRQERLGMVIPSDTCATLI